jgi:basic membrane protein A
MIRSRSAFCLSVVAALTLLFAACGSDNDSKSGGKIDKLKIGLVTDVGKIDDKSFNQSAWEGVQQTKKDLGAEVKFVETTDPKDYAKNIEQFATAKYNVIVTVGFGLGEATVAAAKKYPNIKFIGVDQFQAETLPNLSGLIFDEDKAGYLAGALAAQMSKSGTIGQVLGTDVVPPVVKFGKGYEAGAKSIKADIKVLTWYHPGGLAKGFTDPEEGKKQALQMISQGADVIFGAGGGTGNGALLGCAEKNVLAIGVDTDQYLTLPQAQKVLLSSAMKLITPGVFDLAKAAKDGSFKGGNAIGNVGLAPFHDLDSQVPAPVKQKLQEIDKGLKDGSVKTNVKV